MKTKCKFSCAWNKIDPLEMLPTCDLKFSRIGPEYAPLPQYVICKEVLANDSMRLCVTV